jgi:YidC/Oxa1 family membrane protein insertase
LAFGSVAAPRAFSLWGYGSKSSPDPEAVAASADASTTQAVVGRPQENLAETVAAADASSPSLAATPPPPADPSSTTQQGLDAISDIVNSSGSEILSREEGFGYLSSLGLDYGWGPTSAMQWLLEHMHVWTGLGWGGSIIATAFVLRALMFYPQIRSTIFSHKMRKLQEDPRFKQAQAEGRRGMLERDQAASQTSRYLTSLVKKEYDVDNKQFLWALAPIPFSFGLFRAVTGMVAIPVPALESAGYMWFTDLTASDPFMVLPALATGMMMLSLKVRFICHAYFGSHLPNLKSNRGANGT